MKCQTYTIEVLSFDKCHTSEEKWRDRAIYMLLPTPERKKFALDITHIMQVRRQWFKSLLNSLSQLG